MAAPVEVCLSEMCIKNVFESKQAVQAYHTDEWPVTLTCFNQLRMIIL